MAHRAWLATELGSPDAVTCAAFARRALDGDLLLAEAGNRAGFHCCVRALIFTDQFAEAEAAIREMRDGSHGPRLAAAAGGGRLVRR